MRASPTPRLLIGFAVILLAVCFYSLFTLRQVANLRKLQSDIVERNRRDSLQLLRIQDTLTDIGFALHDSVESSYGVMFFEPQFRRLRYQLGDALREEADLSPNPRRNSNQEQLTSLLHEFNLNTEKAFAEARAGNQKQSIALISGKLRAERASLSDRIFQMLLQNNEIDRQTETQITRIYDRVERDLYSFLLATILAIGVTGLALLYANRRIFEQLANLSNQKSVLARKLITVQEEVLRSISRELHDEFGQILTAIGAMLARLERKGVPPDSPLRADLGEIRGVTQEALDKVRSLSQMLHPAVIDDYGLEKAMEWYVPMFEKQTGVTVRYEKKGKGPAIREETAIHVYRVLQEALNNVARHSGAKRATVRVHYAPDHLRLEIEDSGKGLAARSPGDRTGLGLVAMRERAELVHGRLNLESSAGGGTLVSLEVPIPHDA